MPENNLTDNFVEWVRGELEAHADEVQEELRQVLAKLGQTACLQQVNIFRATNEIGPIKPLLGGTAHA